MPGLPAGGCWAAAGRSSCLLPLQYIFADAYAQYLWITFDFCNTIRGFSIPFRAADLLLHSKASDLLLGFDRSHPNKQVRASELAGGRGGGSARSPSGLACGLRALCVTSSALPSFALKLGSVAVVLSLAGTP